MAEHLKGLENDALIIVNNNDYDDLNDDDDNNNNANISSVYIIFI